MLRSGAIVCVLCAITACGRLDFDPRAVDAARGLDATAASGAISHAQVFAANQGASVPAVHTFTAAAAAAGDLVVAHLYCNNNTVDPHPVTVTAPGWSFTTIADVSASADSEFVTSVVALAPDTSPATFTVTWGATCLNIDDLADEFSGTFDLATAIDSHDEHTGMLDCTNTVTAVHSGDAVWAACTTLAVSGVAAGYTKGADDAHGDWSEYRITADPAGTVEMPTFTNTSGQPFISTAVALSAL